MEAAIRWSPHSTPDDRRFLIADVAGNRLRHCRVRSLDKKKVEYAVLAKKDKVSNFTAFDWYRNDESLVVTGDGFGATRIVRLEAEDAAPSDYISTFKIRQERKCNSVAISSQGLIATAYDKARTDPSLNLYDINQHSGSDPVRRLANADAVANVKFFPGQPDLLLAGTVQPKQGAFLRLYDLRDSIQAGSSAFVTRHCHLLSIDPLDENYFASAGPTGDPVVSIWDKRALSRSTSASLSGLPPQNSVLEIRPAIATSPQANIWSVRFSGYRRGCFAVLSSLGQVRCFETARSPPELEPDLHGAVDVEVVWSDAQHRVRRSHELQKPWSGEAKSAQNTTRAIALDFAGPGCLSENACILSIRSNKTLEIITIPFLARAASVNPKHDVARQRCMQGYLLDCEQNKRVLSRANDGALIEMWDTVKRLDDMAKNAGMVHEALDLSYLGVNNVWNGTLGPNPNRVSRLFSRSSKPSTRPEFTNAIHYILYLHSYGAFKGVDSEYRLHRQLSLAICGWRFSERGLRAKCKEMSDAGDHYKAILYAFTHDRKDIAIEILRAASQAGFSENVGLAVVIVGSPLTDEQRALCSWMAEEADNPYLKALLTYFVKNRWQAVMDMQELPLTFRVAIALKYAPDEDLSAFIEQETTAAITSGSVEGVVLTGLTESSMDLFQNYIRRTSDIQTAVLATSFSNPRYVTDPRWDYWRTIYHSKLQSWRAFPQRVRFDATHNRMSKARDGRSLVQPPLNQTTLRCTNCQSNPARRPPQPAKDITDATSDLSIADNESTTSISSTFNMRSPAASAGTICFTCGRPLPRCSLCLMHLGSPDPVGSGKGSGKWKKTDTERDEEKLHKGRQQLVWFCIKCGHGAHASEAREWFQRHRVCMEAGCSCACCRS